jgi:hypothetical protein
LPAFLAIASPELAPAYVTTRAANVCYWGYAIALRNVRFWPKADIASCTDMSAFEGEADMAFCEAHVCFAVAMGAKRTYPVAPHMSAYDPKRTFDDAAIAPKGNFQWQSRASQFQMNFRQS